MRDREEELTERLLRDAGIAPGMKVLDIGCGHGRVTAIAAALVGDEGRVVGDVLFGVWAHKPA